MIRDPSDGSVRAPKEITLQVNEINDLIVEKPSGEITSGLAPDHSNRAARLQKSREWLRNYHQEKTHAPRGTNETGHQADGSASNDQGGT